MSRVLSALLNQPPADTALFVLALEKLSGHKGIDVKLAVEIEKVAAGRIEALGLDPRDTSSQELYHCLVAKFADDNHRFTRILGGRSGHTHIDLVPLVAESLNKLNIPKTCWAPKRSEIRKILKQIPPKKTMKFLGYRTIDSLLKRENPDELLAAATLLESSMWAKNFNRELSKLTAGDFEKRDAEIICLSGERWKKLPSAGTVVGYVPLSGSVIVWPANPQNPTALALALLILQALWGLRVATSWLEFSQMKPDIGKRILDIVDGDSLKACVSIGGQSIGWRNLVYNFGKSKQDSVGRFGHFDFRDVKFLPPVTVLSRIDPGLRWWLGLEYAGFSRDKTVSFNITDAALNYANGSAFEAASSSWLELDLKDELLSRYLASPWVEDHLLQQLEENSF